jgi:hypothetical protein
MRHVPFSFLVNGAGEEAFYTPMTAGGP